MDNCDRIFGGSVSENYRRTSAYKNEAGRCFSSRVIVEVEPQVPVVFFQGRENSVCRKGLPRRYIPPWDIRFIEQGREEQVETAVVQDDEEVNNDAILTNVDDYWFKVTPLIDNGSNHYLIITDFNLRVVLNDRGQRQSQDVNFAEGYCETTPLYIFDASGEPSGDPSVSSSENASTVWGSFTHPSDINKRFVMGNLIFYAGGLPTPQIDAGEASQSFGTIRIPRYTVYWQMLGSFYRLIDSNKGEVVAGFQKKGSFYTQPSSF